MHSVILTGMMGTGKTTVGRIVAEHRGCEFVDLDDAIERAAGRSVASIFADEGEAGFRAREKAAVRAVADGAQSRHVVLATGGWTVADPESRAALERVGHLVCLTAAPEALEQRLVGPAAEARPLRDGDLAALARRRGPVYDSIALQVATTGRDPACVAGHVERLLGRVAESPDVFSAATITSLPVATPTGGYSVLIGPGLLELLGALLSARGLAGGTVVVTDPTVGRLYCRQTLRSLRNDGIRASRATMPGGESGKSLATVAWLYDRFLANGLDRDGKVVAFGGGVVGDTGGFAAATYLRGVGVVQAPTSLLAMVDASIGGKTAVNLPQGKNLAGAFHHPAVVIADPAVLVTLRPREVRAGLAEVVKAAIIGDPDLLMDLETSGAPAPGDAAAWSNLVGRAARVKSRIVSEDPEERGGRVVLNLGHTFAHGLESATGHALTHGEAVAVGLAAAADLAARIGLSAPDTAARVERVLLRLGLPTRYSGPEPSAVLEAMSPDKKRRQGRLRFVLPDSAGNVRLVTDVRHSDVLAVLRSRRAG
jgi:3-dehydroquinate synthase